MRLPESQYVLHQAAELVLGTSVLVVIMATSYVHVIVFIVLYGFCDGVFITTLSVLVMTSVVPSKVPAALGWQLQISSFLASGPPVAGRSIYPKRLDN